MAKQEREIRGIKKGYFTENFLWGPVPMDWLQKLALLGGRDVFKVGIQLWYLNHARKKGRKKNDIVFINLWFAAQFGVAPRTLKNSLDKMADAGLIRYVKQGIGQRPVVKLLYVKMKKGVIDD